MELVFLLDCLRASEIFEIHRKAYNIFSNVNSHVARLRFNMKKCTTGLRTDKICNCSFDYNAKFYYILFFKETIEHIILFVYYINEKNQI